MPVSYTHLDVSDIRVVIGLDFGTTYSGFAYCHVSDEDNVCSNVLWCGEAGQVKTNTVLQYDNDYNEVKLWGAPALAKKQGRKKRRKTVATAWPMVDYFENVLLVITIPAEFSETAKAIMRTCAFDAGLIKKKYSTNLQFTTEPEAAAIYCMKKNLNEQALAQPGTNFMIVDCGGGTVDVTTRKLLNEGQLGEITERAGDFCGSTYVDVEFIKYLRKILGNEAMDLLENNIVGQRQYLIQQFCKDCKFHFTGEDRDYCYTLDIDETIPILKDYVTNNHVREGLEENDWTIDIDFATVKSIFEPVIQRILKLIKGQLRNSQEPCSAMFLVGGFSESKYLQKRIKQEFQHIVKLISVPVLPTAAISRGATMYGLSISSNLNNIGNNRRVISSRILKYSYGCDMWKKWEHGDPIDRRTPEGFIAKFKRLAKRGTTMGIDQEVTVNRVPIFENQDNMITKIYYTREYDAEYCDDPGVMPLGDLIVDLPGEGFNRRILFGLTFGKMEIIATSRDKQTGQSYRTTFKFNLDE
ncbi:hypothetical protein GLOIN_2v1678543 [Rhizophagus irregularis DAOM 181602=DAOM 197198]|uniref:Actin-like ATPase domain-containing protein n=1 Tax=Rhizophagus irregularis (strain DAOM 181602 / DAOM 197198 / MUCL 43194) TaxID=747089 RepID=A0A2P4PFE3_RHIID|nr:hypothetical protein GLOIN_2v1678543 [Rhizophagus irregularis DAOM 181602=DAOM 197198]POG64101.1 hypothetical protein GLOIN_2v1678543 [Rhizophagus irregularis DAOM 181602=DAOM 197198]|eukprot:XP_025170967.1 hypothetical protein GLOIN_2v1678543 [Rhizophagus irregularis DAOM 181602=DAOM 197198]